MRGIKIDPPFFTLSGLTLALGLILSPAISLAQPTVRATRPATVELVPGGDAVTVVLVGENLHLADGAVVLSAGRETGVEVELGAASRDGRTRPITLRALAGARALAGLEVTLRAGRASHEVRPMTLAVVSKAPIDVARTPSAPRPVPAPFPSDAPNDGEEAKKNQVKTVESPSSDASLRQGDEAAVSDGVIQTTRQPIGEKVVGAGVKVDGDSAARTPGGVGFVKRVEAPEAPSDAEDQDARTERTDEEPAGEGVSPSRARPGLAPLAPAEEPAGEEAPAGRLGRVAVSEPAAGQEPAAGDPALKEGAGEPTGGIEKRVEGVSGTPSEDDSAPDLRKKRPTGEPTGDQGEPVAAPMVPGSGVVAGAIGGLGGARDPQPAESDPPATKEGGEGPTGLEKRVAGVSGAPPEAAAGPTGETATEPTDEEIAQVADAFRRGASTRRVDRLWRSLLERHRSRLPTRGEEAGETEAVVLTLRLVAAAWLPVREELTGAVREIESREACVEETPTIERRIRAIDAALVARADLRSATTALDGLSETVAACEEELVEEDDTALAAPRVTVDRTARTLSAMSNMAARANATATSILDNLR